VKHRRNAVLWAIGWWLVRRQIRRRAATALAEVGAGASATASRGRVRAALGAVLLVGVLAAGFVVARRVLAGEDAGEPDESATLDAAGGEGEGSKGSTESLPGPAPA
jgi:hypothetical protein